MKVKQITEIIEEIQDCKFELGGGLDQLESFRNSGTKRYWRIGIRIKQDNTNSKPYALIVYQLHINENELHFPCDSIGFEFDSVNKTISYAKIKFIQHIEDINFKQITSK